MVDNSKAFSIHKKLVDNSIKNDWEVFLKNTEYSSWSIAVSNAVWSKLDKWYKLNKKVLNSLKNFVVWRSFDMKLARGFTAVGLIAWIAIGAVVTINKWHSDDVLLKSEAINYKVNLSQLNQDENFMINEETDVREIVGLEYEVIWWFKDNIQSIQGQWWRIPFILWKWENWSVIFTRKMQNEESNSIKNADLKNWLKLEKERFNGGDVIISEDIAPKDFYSALSLEYDKKWIPKDWLFNVLRGHSVSVNDITGKTSINIIRDKEKKNDRVIDERIRNLMKLYYWDNLYIDWVNSKGDLFLSGKWYFNYWVALTN